MKKFLLTLCLVIASAALVRNETASMGQMLSSASEFLKALTGEQQAAATFRFEDEERFDFHFIPRVRKGLSFKEMTPAQRKLAHAFLASGLSTEGYLKAGRIMYLERILWEMENQSPRRDPELYFYSVFGTPSMEGIWGWRVEGHHLSLNFTFKDGRLVSSTPAFWGANPAHVRQGPHAGLRVLAEEEDRGRLLLHSLDEEQRTKAVIEVTAPDDILTGNMRYARLDALVGIPFSELNLEQADLLLNLIRIYANRLRPEVAQSELEKIRKAGLDKLHFAWAGGPDKGDPHYYRIHSPDFVIEYDNTQDNANHIHTVWRDFTNDFGRDWLADHYARHHDDQTVGHGADHHHSHHPGQTPHSH